jgi:hypothetical protein
VTGRELQQSCSSGRANAPSSPKDEDLFGSDCRNFWGSCGVQRSCPYYTIVPALGSDIAANSRLVMCSGCLEWQARGPKGRRKSDHTCMEIHAGRAIQSLLPPNTQPLCMFAPIVSRRPLQRTAMGVRAKFHRVCL